MHDDNDNTHDLTYDGEPGFHELRVGVLRSWAVDEVGWEITFDWAQLDDGGGEIGNYYTLSWCSDYFKESIVNYRDYFLDVLLILQ